MVLMRASDVVGAYHCASDGAVWAQVWLFSIAMVQPWCWCFRDVGTCGDAGASEDAIMTTVLYDMMDDGSVDTIDGAGAISGATAHI